MTENSPKAIDVEEGKVYAWCSCGKSKTMPLCDGTHKDLEGDHKPVIYKAEKTETVYFCMCGKTKSAPKCDGTHSKG